MWSHRDEIIQVSTHTVSKVEIENVWRTSWWHLNNDSNMTQRRPKGISRLDTPHWSLNHLHLQRLFLSTMSTVSPPPHSSTTSLTIPIIHPITLHFSKSNSSRRLIDNTSDVATNTVYSGEDYVGQFCTSSRASILPSFSTPHIGDLIAHSRSRLHVLTHYRCVAEGNGRRHERRQGGGEGRYGDGFFRRINCRRRAAFSSLKWYYIPAPGNAPDNLHAG